MAENGDLEKLLRGLDDKERELSLVKDEIAILIMDLETAERNNRGLMDPTLLKVGAAFFASGKEKANRKLERIKNLEREIEKLKESIDWIRRN